MNCFVCEEKAAVVNYPFDPFYNREFGTMAAQEFRLCGTCEHLFTHHFFHSLTQLFVLAVQNKCGHDHLSDNVYCADVYSLLRQFEFHVKARYN